MKYSSLAHPWSIGSLLETSCRATQDLWSNAPGASPEMGHRGCLTWQEGKVLSSTGSISWGLLQRIRSTAAPTLLRL